MKIGKIIRSIEIFVLTLFAIPEKYFKNLAVKDLPDNRKFLKTITVLIKFKKTFIERKT